MAKQVINVGTAANDGTGDDNRAAWVKSNANFTELYDADAAHLVAADPHTQYALEASLGALALLNTVATAQIDADAVTFAKFQNITDARLLGRSAGSDGDMQHITVGSGLSLSGGALTASPGGFTTIVATANEDATNEQNKDHTQFQFAVVANQLYAVEMELYFSGNNSTGDYEFRFAVSAGTMQGHGEGLALDGALSPGSVALIAAGAATTGNAARGTAAGADLTYPSAANVTFAFKPDTNGTLKFQFGNSATSSGRISRTLAGSVMRYKTIG